MELCACQELRSVSGGKRDRDVLDADGLETQANLRFAISSMPLGAPGRCGERRGVFKPRCQKLVDGSPVAWYRTATSSGVFPVPF